MERNLPFAREKRRICGDSLQQSDDGYEVDGKTFIPDIITMKATQYRRVAQALQEIGRSPMVNSDPVFLRVID